MDTHEINRELVKALEALRHGYQQHFEIMPVCWQTYDEIARQAIELVEKDRFLRSLKTLKKIDTIIADNREA